MILKIGGIDISGICTPPVINKTARSQAVRHALDGTTTIDRMGKLKYGIDITIPLVSGSLWFPIAAVISEISFEVVFTYGNETVTSSFWLDGDIPCPVLLSDGDTLYCYNISISLKEV